MADTTNKVEDILRDINKFQSQCFLKDHMRKLNEIKKKISNSEPYENFVILEGDPGLMVHQLVSKKNVNSLFNLTPAQTALLVPKIQIFKVFYGEK